jgi:hypothetical protein
VLLLLLLLLLLLQERWAEWWADELSSSQLPVAHVVLIVLGPTLLERCRRNRCSGSVW